MSCASCAVSAESIVKSTKGVVSASVNYANAMLTVEYQPTITNPSTIQQAVQSVGYDLLLEDETQQQEIVDALHDKNFKSLKTKTIWAVLLAFPVMLIGMFFMHIKYANQVMWLLSTPVVLWLGKDFFINAWKQAQHRTANMDTLVALSTGIAYIFSLFNLFFPEFLEIINIYDIVPPYMRPTQSSKKK